MTDAITRYAQAQQIAGNWEFNEDDEDAWYEFGPEGKICYLFVEEEGWSLRVDTGEDGNWAEGPRVPVTSLKQLKALVKG